MRQLTNIELARSRLIKAYRTAIRLKHALAADEEINSTLPEVIARFEKAVAAGEKFELTPGEVFSVE